VRLLYICLSYLAVPIALWVHLWRGLMDRAHWSRLTERLGFGAYASPGGFWVHAVSVGEVQAAATLIASLRRRYPSQPLTLSTSTVTGRQQAERLWAGQDVSIRYLPYDTPRAVRRCLNRVQPRVLVLMETEIWPTLYGECQRRHIPLLIASARLSIRSVQAYGRLGSLVRRALTAVTWVGAQTPADAQRFVEAGADPGCVDVMGNIKFDVAVPPELGAEAVALRAQWGVDRPVWVAGSTHEGEERAVLESHRRVMARCPQALLVWAPRHPPRFSAVAALLKQHAMPFITYSDGGQVPAETQVVLVDMLGVLLRCYGASDVAFVGGSLAAIGGHNVLEPAALAKPIVVGPSLHHVQTMTESLRSALALDVVADAEGLSERLLFLLAHSQEAKLMGARAYDVLQLNRGALSCLEKALDLVWGKALLH
jgi:3-deoxy-D-manno-octulosonic-acid transferase